MMNFFIFNIQTIALAIWSVVAVVLMMRYFRVPYVVRVPWWCLVLLVVVLHFGYVAFITVAQYQVWGSNEFTKDFLMQPLAHDVPLPFLLEWARSWFEGPLGYFSFYVFGRYVLSLVFLFVTAIVLGLLLLLRARHRPLNFKEGDIPALILSALVSGWPGVIVLVPLGFIIALVISALGKILYRVERTYLPPAFLIAALVANIWGVSILKMLNLYTLLKL